ncbi:unnamed protein product [Lactuca virosa]|uniref:Protein kinase domain-containing protein n=1 Tax=Lactuca virosa TaxID=75947 RepID=A0AAU9NWY0_9ASTR|nr:unnamed protein product [Lactuca virosa]
MCGRTGFNHPDWFLFQLAKQHPKDESQDVLGKLDQIIEHDGYLFDVNIEEYHSIEGFEYLDIPNEEFLAPIARVHYEKRKLDDMIDPDLLKQMDPQSFHLFSGIAYCCIKEQRSTRPDIHQVVIRLEKALDLQREHDETLNLKEYTEDEDASTNHLKVISSFSLRFANDAIYTEESSNGIAAVARRHFNEGTIRDMVDARLIEETHLNMFSPNKGPDQDSLYAFSTVAYQCVAESQAERPTAGVIVKKLKEALSFQVS